MFVYLVQMHVCLLRGWRCVIGQHGLLSIVVIRVVVVNDNHHHHRLLNRLSRARHTGRHTLVRHFGSAKRHVLPVCLRWRRRAVCWRQSRAAADSARGNQTARLSSQLELH